jgi:hypothetical protein
VAGLRRRQATQVEAVEPCSGEPIEDHLGLGVAEADGGHHRLASHQALDDLERGRVGPLQVVEDEHPGRELDQVVGHVVR